MDPNVCHMFRSILATLGVCVSEAFGIFGQNLGSPNWILVKPECLFRFWQYLGVLPIRMHAKLCTYLIILYTLTFKHSTIECAMHRHELFKGNKIECGGKMMHSSKCSKSYTPKTYMAPNY